MSNFSEYFFACKLSYQNNSQSSSQSSRSAQSVKQIWNSYSFSEVLFPSLQFLRTYIFWKELVCLIFKSLLTFLTFVNFEGPYFAEGFLLNLRPCFDIAFAQLGVIPSTKNKLVKIVAVAECYLITNHVKNIKEAAVPNMPSCKIS